MKKQLFLTLLLVCAFSWLSQPLEAQTPKRFSFFIPDVEGQGEKDDDNSFLHYMTVTEVKQQGYGVQSTPRDVDYLLTGTIRPGEEKGYVFFLTLTDNKTGMDFIEQFIAYETVGEVTAYFPQMMYNIFSNLFALEAAAGAAAAEAAAAAPSPTAWHDDKILFFGVSGIWAPRSYIDEHESIYYGNFGVGLAADLCLWRFIFFSFGIDLANDWVCTVARDYRDLLFEIPVAVKFAWVLNTASLFEPYAGININLTITGFTRPSIISWMGGLQYGRHFGPGVFLIDARYSSDAFRSTLETLATYHRSSFRIGVGYKWGFFTKPAPKDKDKPKDKGKDQTPNASPSRPQPQPSQDPLSSPQSLSPSPPIDPLSSPPQPPNAPPED